MRESVFLLNNDFNALLKNNEIKQNGGGLLLGAGKKGKVIVKDNNDKLLEVPKNNVISLGELYAIVGGGYENARKNIPSLSRFKKLKGSNAKKATNFAKKLIGGSYTYTTENGPCGDQHLANIVEPVPHCALAPNPVDDVSSNSGILYATQAGGSKNNLISDNFLSSYMILALNKGKKMNGGSRVPYAVGKEMKNLYGNHSSYKFSDSSILSKAKSWRGGGISMYRKRLSENLKILSNMEKKNKFRFDNMTDIKVPLSVLSNNYTQVGAGLPLEYFGGKTENYSSNNSQDIPILTPHQSGGGVTGMPLEYYGGKTEHYNSENSQDVPVLTPHQSGGGVTGMPLEYYGGKTEHYSSENSQEVPVLTPHQSGGGVTGMPLEYYGGKTEHYSSENSQDVPVLTPHQSGGSRRFKLPILSDPVMGGILKTLGIFTLPVNALIPFSLLVFAYEKYLASKYADEPSLENDKIVDTLLKAKGAFALHPMLATAMSTI